MVDTIVAQRAAPPARPVGISASAEALLSDCERALAQARCEQLHHLSRTLDQVLHAATWLIGLGIKIRSVKIERQQAVLRVENTRFLWQLFAGDCAWRERRQDGERTVYTWFAVRYGTRIEWEES